MKAFAWIAITLALSTSSQAEEFRFHSSTFRVGPFPNSIVAVDLNGDSIPEIVTANRGHLSDPSDERPGNDQLSYLAATTPLEYKAQPQLRTGFGPYAVTVANIDALKEPDLVVANFMATRNRDLSLLRNLRDNLFEVHNFGVDDAALLYTQRRDGAGAPIFTTPGLTALEIADFDGDGYRDAVATGWSSDALVYFPGEPDAYFTSPIIIPLSGSPRDLAAHDFDNDGRKDLVVVCYGSSEIVLLKGTDDGVFEEVNRFASHGALPSFVELGDFNGNGRTDIAVGHRHAEDSIAIFYRSSGFEFPVSQDITLGKDRNKLEAGIRDIHAADFNNDGKSDIAVSCFTAQEVVVLMNTSEDDVAIGTFRRNTTRVKKGRPKALCSADFNGDGRLDIAVTLWEENRVALLMAQ